MDLEYAEMAGSIGLHECNNQSGHVRAPVSCFRFELNGF